MKDGKKPLGIKQKIREERKREQCIGLVLTVAILIAIVLLSVFIVNSMLNQSPARQTISPTLQPKAAIVDQLSLTLPNQTFIQNATAILGQAGYTVDYYSGERVTVDFYRSLPSLDYKIILLRVHSGHNPEKQEIGFFTSEAYSSSKYIQEQLTDCLNRVAFSYPTNEGEPTYFAISPLFVESSMKGRFNGTIIIVMSCYGLEYPCMAQALVDKGAKAYISWDGSVSADHTDKTAIRLLQHLISEKQAIGQAVRNTMTEVGPDPQEKSQLAYYPLEAGIEIIDRLNGQG